MTRRVKNILALKVFSIYAETARIRDNQPASAAKTLVVPLSRIE